MTIGYKSPCDGGVIRSGAAAGSCAARIKRWTLAATILGSSLAFIDGTVVNVALPALQADLDATVTDVQWVVESYALFLAALLLVGGALGDRWGRRKLFAMGVALFALASIWCGFAPDVGQLIAARSIQGIGAALLVPGSLSIISATFPEAERGRAIGTWSGFTAITMAVGPVLGGWLIDTVSWRAVFFINIPLAAIVILIALWQVPESQGNMSRQKLDWGGALLATIGLGGVTYGLLEYSNLDLQHPLVITALAVGILSLAGFFVLEARLPYAMMPLYLFGSSTFSGANLLTLLLYAALGGGLFFFPFALIQVHGYSATEAGAALLPFVVTMFLLSRWAGGLVDRHGSRLPLLIGPTIAAAGFALFALPGTEGGYWTTFFPAVFVLGLGMTVAVAPLTTTVMAAVGQEYAGVASGINNAVSRVASVLAIAVLGIVVLQVFTASMNNRLDSLPLTADTRQAMDGQLNRLAGAEPPPGVGEEEQRIIREAIKESFVDGFRVAMLIAAALALASGAIAWVMIEDRVTSPAEGAAPRPPERSASSQ